MGKRIVVLGGGTGGTLIANRLRRLLDRSAAEITVIDADDEHLYQPGLLFVPVGKAGPGRLTRPRHRQFRPGVTFRQAAVGHVDLDRNEVRLTGGTSVGYDVLVIATGARLVPEETDGLTGPGWMEKVFTFYTLDGALALRRTLAGFTGGRLAVAVMDMPIKCPVAPLEFCFLADAYFRERGIRNKVDLTYVSPLDGAFTKPVCDRELSGLLKGKGVNVVTEFNTGEVDGAGGRLISFDGREVPFDLAVVVPLHGGQDYVSRSPGLGDELGFVPADQRTLQSKARPNVFVIGDAADIPTSKAGSVAHFEGETVAGNIVRYLAGEPLDADFDGHTNCFIESGTYAGTPVTVNDEGFFTDPRQWREDMAPLIARQEGITELTERHWQVIKFMRHEYDIKGSAKIEKVSIIISKGSLEGVYPGLIMANGARAEGMEANLFFTFFGLDAVHKARHEHIKLATVGNPGLHLATWAGGLPGVSSVMTHYLNHKMEQLDIPSIPEFVEMIADTGAGLYACKASADLFGLTKADLIDQVKDIITVGEFYDMSAGGQIIFT